MYRSMSFAMLLTFASTCLAQFSYAPINFPGAVATVARGINNSGEVVGYYQTTACENSDLNIPSCPTEGFKLVHGRYIKVRVPNSTATAVTGVNELGDLVGFYTKSDGTRHGFVWYHQNVIKTIDLPGTPYKTVPMGINNAGTVVGGLWSIGATGTFSDSGWVWANGKFRIMNAGGSIHAPCCQSVNGISNSGMFVGQLFYRESWQTWLKAATDVRNDQIGDTLGTGLNNYGDVTGYKTVGKGWFGRRVQSGKGKGDTEGTLRLVLVSYPNARSTQSFGVNDSRYLVGSYMDATGKRHGFIAQPEPGAEAEDGLWAGEN
jgi:hypothetical protein